jgi:hypothetical protein
MYPRPYDVVCQVVIIVVLIVFIFLGCCVGYMLFMDCFFPRPQSFVHNDPGTWKESYRPKEYKSDIKLKE